MPRRFARLAALAAALACAPVPLAAQDADLAEMRARDRLGPPAQELAAWQAFAEPVLADPQTPDRLRAETLLGLAVARYYTRDYEQGWADIRAAEAALGDMVAPFHAELLAYASMLALAVEEEEAARSYAARARAMADAMGPGGEKAQALARNAEGGLAFADNDLVAAEAAYCAARDLGLAAAQPDHPMVVNDASSCAAVKYYLERPDTIAAVRVARDHALAHLPPDHTRMGNVLNTGYAVLMRYGRYAEALPLIRRHLELERSLRGPDDPYVYDALSMLGRALELPPLPRAQAELEALAEALGGAPGSGAQLILAGADATEPNLAAQDLPGFGVIAFATHGLLGGEVPGLAEPALLLTPGGAQGQAADGLLTASEIATLSLDADWVILSACETAAGARSGAPGYSGLARAFAGAGARSLMLSHWRVRDDAAAMLSVETVRGAAAGLPRAEALRQAQLALMARADVADAAHPAIWAPFVILEN